MQAAPFTPQSLVAEVFDQLPDSMAVFIAEGTDCVGCALERFCTLREVSLHYALDVKGLIQKLEAVREGNQSHR